MKTSSNEEVDAPVLLAPCPQKRVTDKDWIVIKSLAERGVSYKEIGNQFGISHFTVGKRASKERWITPMRLSKAKNGTLVETNDPSLAVAALWTSRAEAARESIYQGAQKALSRFWALSPIPQSFAEAATAEKLLSKAIDPSEPSRNQPPQTTVNILASNNFQPKPINPINI